MPVVSSSRVKNTGTGEIVYSDQDSANSAIDAGAAVDGASGATTTTVTSVLGENIGNGVGVFAGSNGSDNIMLDFKSLVAGDNVTITQDAETITITATGNGTSSGGGTGNGASDGFHLVLGDVVADGDGSWANGAVPLTDNTSVSAAVDALNEMLGLLIPVQPASFPGGPLSIINTAGNVPMLAAGVTDNASSGLSAGTAVTRIATNSVSTNVFNDVGPGDHGTLQLFINNAVVGSHTLTGTDAGTYGGLVISDQKSYPVSTPGFWKSIDVSVVTAPVSTGINKIKINDTAAGVTNEPVFVRDDMIGVPTVSLGTVSQVSAGTLVYSSGVPHYGTGASLAAGLSFTNLSGETYYGANDPFSISGSNGIASSQTFTYPQAGFNPPFARQTINAQPINPVVVNVDGNNIHGSGKLNAVVRNVNGASGSTQLSATEILVKRGSTSNIDEMSIPVTGLGVVPNNNNAVRVSIPSNVDQPVGSAGAWNSANTIVGYEAAVVGGILSHNQINYLTGYLPVGPNYSSGRTGPQYITLSFQRQAVSNFKINVTGTYAGVWIQLPDVSDDTAISPHAVNGWWNAGVAYSGAGVPGNPSDASAGCAAGAPMLGTSGSYTVTFGPETSTNAASNTILVRIRLNAGHRISALSFSN